MRFFHCCLVLFICVLVGRTAGPAHAEKRVALVIGNGAYIKVGKLSNPARDAAAFAALLRAARFDVVDVRSDLGVTAMRRTLRDFSDQAHAADIAVVFYAGHGIEVNGTNHLIPVDAALERDIDVEDETVPLDRVTQVIERAKRLRLVILDACRDNPFVGSMKRTAAGRSIGRGLARVDVLASDTLVAFAAKHGSTAADGDGTNSPYTTALVRHLATPGLDLRLALGRVRDDVVKSTGNKQEPFLYGSLGGAEIALVPAGTPQPQAVPIPGAPGTPSSANEAKEAWNGIKDAASIPALEAFIRRFPDTFYSDLAKVRLADLQQQAAAAKKKAEESALAGASRHLPAPIAGAAACMERGGVEYCVSSVLPRGGLNTGEYGPRSLLDGDATTAWVEGRSGDGIGEWIVLSWAVERQLSALRVVNGYGKSGRLFDRNGRVTRARLDFSDGRSMEVVLRDSPEAQQLTISPSVRTRWVRLQILEVARGAMYSDTAISELSPVFE